MESNMETTSKKINISNLVLNGIFVAIVFVATFFIQIRLPISINGGLIHLGNVALFSIAILFGKRSGAIAGALGMGLFDVMSGWIAWAPFTFVVRGVMGYIIGSIAHSKNKEGNSFFYNLIGIVIGGIWMIAGYYATEGLLYGNWIAPITSIPGNLTQIGLGILIGLPLVTAVKKTKLL